MEASTNETKQMATQLLAALLANPHIYAKISDEGSRGQQEQALMLMAIEMAQDLIKQIEEKTI